MNNNIRISPGGVSGKKVWTIDISTDGSTWRKSPDTYKENEVWGAFYKIALWFYKKHSDK